MIPVTVRLANSNVDRHITQRLSGLSWRSVAPGGYASATFSLQQPIDVSDPMVAPFTRVYIYDGRSGDTLWEGRLQMPGRSAGDQGQVWAITAIGPSAHTLDQTAPLIYVDRDLTSMYRNNSLPAADAGVGADPGNGAKEEALVLRFPNGITVTTGSNIAMIYDRIAQAGMLVGGLTYDWDAGFTNAAFNVETVLTPSTVVIADDCDVAGGSRNGLSAGASLGTGHNTLTFRLLRESGGVLAISGDATWAAISNLSIRGQLVTKTGAAITGTGTYSNAYVLAREVVADLLGRMLPQYDGAGAALTAVDTVNIDQFAYADAVNPSQVLDDLMQLEPGSYWAAWESNAAGKYRFEWANWPTSPRYEASVEDGFDSPAPSFEVFNKVRVRFKDPRGRIRIYTRTQPVEMLDNEGIVREAYIDLSDEVGSPSNALAAAVNFLNDHKAPRSGGTLTIARPILDLAAARGVAPWQIKPGELIRVRGIEASYEITGAATRDGVTVFRIVSVEVNGEGVATLELDMFTQTESRALAEVAKRRNRKR